MNTFVTIVPLVGFAVVTIDFENHSYDYIMNQLNKYFPLWKIINMKTYDKDNC
jgi:hypothetical protein